MSDPRAQFVALRDLVEAGADQPPFEVIRSRRRRRTRGQVTVAGAVVLTVVITIGTVLAFGGAGQRSAPPPVAPPPPTVLNEPQAFISTIEGLSATPSGPVYALANNCTVSNPDCDRQAARHRLFVSTDTATSWSPVADAPVGGQLLAASDSQLWISGGVDNVFADGGTGPSSANPGLPVGRRWTDAASTDGGHTWHTWMIEETAGSTGLNNNAEHLAATAGGTTWFTEGSHVYAAAGATKPDLTPTQPPNFNNIYQLVAIGPDHAIVMGSENNTLPSRWFETRDRGAHWLPIADPCAGTPQAGSLFTATAVAPDGSWWVVCVSAPAADPASPGPTFPQSPGPHDWPRQLVLSTDDGQTWQHRGPITDPVTGLGVRLYPRSATMAWRTSIGGNITRTVDGRSWTTARNLATNEEFVWQFAAIDSENAIYTSDAINSPAVFTTTHDGGKTWTTHPLPTVT